MVPTYGIKEVHWQDKFSSNSVSKPAPSLVISPVKYYYFERGDGSEQADERLVRCIKSDTGWSCENVLQETGGRWISLTHIYDMIRHIELMFGDWAVLYYPKLWVVNDTVKTYTYGNSNMINLGHSVYLPEIGKILTGGECSGNRIRLINPFNDWAEEATWTFSWLAGQNFGKIDIVPRTDEKIYVLGGIGSASSSPRNAIIGEVDIEDLLDNPNSNIDELGSWKLIRDFNDIPQCTLVAGYHKVIYVQLYNVGPVIYDPVSDKVINAPGRPWLNFSDGGFAVYDKTNNVVSLYDTSGSKIADITPPSSYGEVCLARDTIWFNMASDSDVVKLGLIALTVDGYTPMPEIDVENKKFRIIDFHTGSVIAFRVKLVWSKAGNGLVSPVITDTTKVSELEVNDWTPLPNPPAAGRWLLTILPTEPVSA